MDQEPRVFRLTLPPHVHLQSVLPTKSTRSRTQRNGASTFTAIVRRHDCRPRVSFVTAASAQPLSLVARASPPAPAPWQRPRGTAAPSHGSGLLRLPPDASRPSELGSSGTSPPFRRDPSLPLPIALSLPCSSRPA